MEKRAVLYIRVSDPSQIENNSLETQEKLCRLHAQSQGYAAPFEIFREEGKSAKTVEGRPELKRLLNFVTKKPNNISAIIVYKFDRFSRNTEEALATISYLSKFGISVLSVTEPVDDNPMGKAMRNIMFTLGQLDNELKGERVKDNMLAVFRKGLWPFKCPIGYIRPYRTKEENKGLAPIPDPNLGPIITKMFHNAATGIYSKSQLARMMNLDAFGQYYRTPADHKIVKEILEKSFYYGRLYAKKWDESAIGLHRPLIDEVSWNKAYERLILKKKKYSYQDVENYPLKGFLFCECCNHALTTSPSQGRNGVITYYECRNKGCFKIRINSVKAHLQFEEILKALQPSNRVIKLFEHMVLSEWDKVINQSKKQVEIIDTQIVDLKKGLSSIRRARDEELYSVDEAREEAERVRNEIRVLEIERSDIKIQQYDAEIVSNFTSQFLGNLGALWQSLDLSKRQAFLIKVFQGELICSEDKIIRISKLSSSFQLIEAIGSEKGENVTPPGFEPGLPG